MNNEEIIEQYCNFEISKKLREKGFNISCTTGYNGDGDFIYDDTYHNWNDEGNYYTAPTHQMAKEWLRKNYEIFVEIRVIEHQTVFMSGNYYYFRVYKDRKHVSHIVPNKYYVGPNEAEEAGLLFALENLI